VLPYPIDHIAAFARTMHVRSFALSGPDLLTSGADDPATDQGQRSDSSESEPMLVIWPVAVSSIPSVAPLAGGFIKGSVVPTT
jgi:hypothetical protein